MERAGPMHYHIRWSLTDELDWERFETHAIAEQRGRELVGPTESYTIEEHGETCLHCARRPAPGH